MLNNTAAPLAPSARKRAPVDPPNYTASKRSKQEQDEKVAQETALSLDEDDIDTPMAKLRFVARASDGEEYDYTELVRMFKAICPDSTYWNGFEKVSTEEPDNTVGLPRFAKIGDPEESFVVHMVELVKDHVANVEDMDASSKEATSAHFQETLNEFFIGLTTEEGTVNIRLLWDILNYLQFPDKSYLRAACNEAKDYHEAARFTQVGKKYRLPHVELPHDGDIKKMWRLLHMTRALYPRYAAIVEDSRALQIPDFSSMTPKQIRELSPSVSPRAVPIRDGQALIMVIDFSLIRPPREFRSGHNYHTDEKKVKEYILKYVQQPSFFDDEKRLMSFPTTLKDSEMFLQNSFLYYVGAQRAVRASFDARNKKKAVTTDSVSIATHMRPALLDSDSLGAKKNVGLLIVQKNTWSLAPNKMIKLKFNFFPKNAVRAVLDWGPSWLQIPLQTFAEDMPNLMHAPPFQDFDPKFYFGQGSQATQKRWVADLSSKLY